MSAKFPRGGGAGPFLARSLHIEIRCCTWRVRHYSRENPALYGRRSSVLVCSACNMPSFAPGLHEQADKRKQLKRPNKKISSCTVDTDVVVLVIPVVQMCEWMMIMMMSWSLTTHQPYWVITCSVIKVR